MVKEIQSTTLQMAVVPANFLDSLMQEVKEVKDILKTNKEKEFANDWIDSISARKMLKISQKTWQTYRDERRIPFSQFGRKICVKRTDLEKFMEQHYINAR